MKLILGCPLQDQEAGLLPLWHPDGYGSLAQFRFLEYRDLLDVRRLHDLAHKLIGRPGLLAAETDSFFESHLSEAGRMLGIEHEGDLIGYCVLGLPNDAEYNFGMYIGLSTEELKFVAHCDGAVVHPAWRGARLHDWMIERRVELAGQLGRYHILSTAAPLNPASWIHLIHSGFAVYRWLEMFGGDRYLLYRNLKNGHQIDRTTLCDIQVTEKLKQRALLLDNWIGISSSRAPVGDMEKMKTFFAKRRI